MESQDQITITIGDRNANRQFPSNIIKTSKYNFVNFLPKSLFAQFHNAANIYFLLLAILISIPIISTLSPITSVAPVIFVLGTGMIREAWEDWVNIINHFAVSHELPRHASRMIRRQIINRQNDIIVQMHSLRSIGKTSRSVT
jgi:hypothetical protein